mgnify:CR=1 FL=1
MDSGINMQEDKLREEYKWIENYLYPGVGYSAGFLLLLLPDILGIPIILLFLTGGQYTFFCSAFIGIFIFLSIWSLHYNLQADKQINRKNVIDLKTKEICALQFGLNCLASSLFFLIGFCGYIYNNDVNKTRATIYCISVASVYAAIVIGQFVLVASQLKMGYYSKSNEKAPFRLKYEQIKRKIYIPILTGLATIAPAGYAISRFVIHGVKDYISQLYILMSVGLLAPYGYALGIHFIHRAYMMRKYKDYCEKRPIIIKNTW